MRKRVELSYPTCSRICVSRALYPIHSLICHTLLRRTVPRVHMTITITPNVFLSDTLTSSQLQYSLRSLVMCVQWRLKLPECDRWEELIPQHRGLTALQPRYVIVQSTTVRYTGITLSDYHTSVRTGAQLRCNHGALHVNTTFMNSCANLRTEA